MIAAIYAALTLVNPFSFGQVQLRVSEMLTILAAVTPAAIPGLTLGCFISNFASFMPLDIIFGTLATLLASVCSYLLRKVKFKGLPILSATMPVVFNGVIVGLMLCIYAGTFTFSSFLTMALFVALGEAVVCGISLLIYPLALHIFKKINL